MKIIVGIPAFNEEKNIAKIITRLNKITDSIVVCNDGSTDLTSEIAQKMGAVVINHEKNLGYGGAIRSIFLKSREMEGDILVTFDADGQHRIEDIEDVINPIINNQADLVIGSRFLDEKDQEVPQYRKMGIKVITKITNASLKQKLTDSQSGFRAYSKKVLNELNPSELGMGISTEILIKASSKNFKISEIQANAILEIKLRQLAKLEQIKLEEEKSGLENEKKDIEKVLGSSSRLKTLIKNELLEIKNEYGDERNSPIESNSDAKVFSEEETLVTEPITVVLSSAGWIRGAKGHDIDPSSLSFRGEDSLQDFCRGRNNQNVVFLDSQGKAYSIPGHTLPSARGMGEPITGRVSADSGVEFLSSVIGNDEDKFIITNSAGYGYISEFKNMVSSKKSGKAFMKPPEGAKLLKAHKVEDAHKYIVAVSNTGRLLIFSLSELPVLGKGKGNKILNIPKAKFESGEESLSHVALLADSSSLRIDSGKQFLTLKIKDLENYISSRAKRGNLLPQGYRKVDSISEEIDSKLAEADQ